MDEIAIEVGLALFFGSIVVFLAAWSLYYKKTVGSAKQAMERQLRRSDELQERSAELLDRQERVLDRVERLLNTVEERFRESLK
jgi:hypothetical protein